MGQGVTITPGREGAAIASQNVVDRLRVNIQRAYFGKPEAVDRVLACLLARGHVLLEDVPGVGKTVLATALAKSLDCRLSRIQFTPDTMPSDVIGVSVYDREQKEFVLKRGPIFANIVLADEVNRTTPRTQSAMLEAMNEASVSVEGRVIPLEQPFMVIATQNPLEFEGTYPLPESQLDRFLMRIRLGYPDPDIEARVLEQRPGAPAAARDARPAEDDGVTIGAVHALEPVATRDDLLSLQRRVDSVHMDRALVDYIVSIANETRRHEAVQVGVSTRGALALAAATRATAVLRGRDYCVPEDVLDNLDAVCSHRLTMRGYGAGERDAASQALQDAVERVGSPA